ncbi:MAG: tRNA guanosine(34) transglycosylase Tgt [Planctomycetota bacterium]
MRFEITAADTGTAARAGLLTLPRLAVATPLFMPVGTRATVKMLTPAQVAAEGARMILANTYHLIDRPGTALIAGLGGLHRFAGWDGGILTDSGGFQVFSLAAMRDVTDAGVRFRSPVDGRELFLSPESVAAAQRDLGSDIAMVLDECPPADASRGAVAAAVERTIAWAARSRDCAPAPGQVQFAIVQGGRFADLRAHCAQGLAALDFPGYAVGGVSVGEPREVRRATLAATVPLLPETRPRYLMGVGEPVDLLDAVARGFDMFDCVLPTRNGRNGYAFTRGGPLHLRNSVHAESGDPLEARCGCYTCGRFSRGYLRHLFQSGEGLGPTLVSLHNIRFFMDLMAEVRTAITAGVFGRFRDEFMHSYYKDGQP